MGQEVTEVTSTDRPSIRFIAEILVHHGGTVNAMIVYCRPDSISVWLLGVFTLKAWGL